ncbi:MAG: TlpA disulfide reductase family protein [Myxococcota bacterium]
MIQSARANCARRILATVLGVVGLACGAADETGESAAPAPDFRLPQLDGGEVALADWAGRPVLIDFWATWCPPCVYQVPELNALYAAHREAGDVGIFGISIDDDDAIDAVRSWTEEKGVEYPILLSDDGLARPYGALGFPTVVLIDPDGNVVWRHAGVIEHEDIEERLEPYLRAP